MSFPDLMMKKLMSLPGVKPSVLAVISLSMAILVIPSASYGVTSCNCVAFTLDGVQDYFLTNVQKDIIRTFEQNGANLTIGIIGNDFGLDPDIASFIKNEISTGDKKSIIEVANNGWKGEDFVTLPKDKQLDLISKTQARINYLLNTQPLTFLSPYGDLNNDTIEAVRIGNLSNAYGFWNNTDVPLRLNDSGIFIVPPSISSGRLDSSTGLYELIPLNELLQGIKQNVTDNGVAVVSMQPLDFAQKNNTAYINKSDQNQIKNLGSLLDDLKNMKIKTVTISKLSGNR